MAARKAVKTKPGARRVNPLHQKQPEPRKGLIAGAIIAPALRHGTTAAQLHKAQFGGSRNSPGFDDYADYFQKAGVEASKGNMELANRLLAAQALTLDNIFTEMARRMALNMGEHLGATQTYARIAMKAQAQSRATLEALARLHQPREQTVRHVHVNEGGQAVIANQFHNHAGGAQNAERDDQSHGAAAGAAGIGPALLGEDTRGNGVPMPSREEPEKVPNARRDKSWRS